MTTHFDTFSVVTTAETSKLNVAWVHQHIAHNLKTIDLRAPNSQPCNIVNAENEEGFY